MMRSSSDVDIKPISIDPEKEIKAWKAYFEYAAEDVHGESPELLVACAHRLLEMADDAKAGKGKGRSRRSKTS